jgi:predicted NBD/HSP70 family sugar kinase
MSLFVGLDIGGTKFMVASADQNGNIIERTRADNTYNFETDLALLNQMITDVNHGEEILGIGAAIGGPLEWEHGIVSPLHQPAWNNIPLKQIMEDRWKCPFYVDVDTNVAVLGEYYCSNITASKLLYITLSTGMGGGFLIDGKVYRGLNGTHPEIGHQSIHYHCINPGAILCECGAKDCLEALISGNGIRRIYGKPAEELSQAEWEEVAYNLGQGLRNLAAILTPDIIRIGGGIAIGGGEMFIQNAAKVMRENLKIVPPPEVSLSHLGYDTALYGAISIAIHGLND